MCDGEKLGIGVLDNYIRGLYLWVSPVKRVDGVFVKTLPRPEGYADWRLKILKEWGRCTCDNNESIINDNGTWRLAD